MSADPSQLLQPLRLAKIGERFDGIIQLNEMPRVTDSLLTQDGGLHYCISFYLDEAKHCIVEISIQTKLLMTCQRCLNPAEIDINRCSKVVIVNNQTEADELITEFEPLVIDEQQLTLLSLVEDELILAIPIAPSHSTNACKATADIERINAESKPNPFAILEKLKKH